MDLGTIWQYYVFFLHERKSKRVKKNLFIWARFGRGFIGFNFDGNLNQSLYYFNTFVTNVLIHPVGSNNY